MSGNAWSVGLLGMEGRMVEVEAAIGGGLPRTVLVGLPDTALYEARDRCKAAVASAGLAWPSQLVTINLTPATLPKSGSHYDLAIVSAVMAASGAVPEDAARMTVLMGELGLDGRVRPVRGILPGLLAAVDAGFSRAIVPMTQVGEAGLVDGLTIWGISSVTELIDVLSGRPVLPTEAPAQAPTPPLGRQPDLVDVVGQDAARWALEVAAAGRHHLFLHGAPGVGKTMLAERLPSILPDLTRVDSLEVSALHSLAGANLSGGLMTRPPYSDPHHNASLASLVGGGARVARPGAISLAHRGVLFMDEAPEFGPKLLEALRTPLESGWVSIGRSEVMTRYPARFQLVLAANPCPCGRAGTKGAACSCAPMAIRRYAERLSGPILDRIDIQVHMQPVRAAYVAAKLKPAEGSTQVAERVQSARSLQAARYAGSPWSTNAEVPGSVLRHDLPLPDGCELLDEALIRGQLSSRGADKVLRVAWSISDLDGADRPTKDHLRVAMAMRRGNEVAGAA
ncbi:MAG TPA: YifB family Mg chelatase-like AAA ATPase [Propionibacteriaceae bacterium]|nr:YifB family Mg chelatase-like AAA ATPase [Propionibacteriaceae bacterium]